VDERTGNQNRTQCGDRRNCQQAGQDQLGSFGERERLSAPAQSGRIFQLDEVELVILSQESAEDSNDENTVKRRA